MSTGLLMAVALMMLVSVGTLSSTGGFDARREQRPIDALRHRLNVLEQQQEHALADSLASFDALLSVRLRSSAERISVLEAQTQLQQDQIDGLQYLLSVHHAELEQLRADLASVKRTTEQTAQQQQQWTNAKGFTSRTWLNDDEPQQAAHRTADLDFFSAPFDWTEHFIDTAAAEDDILTALFGTPTEAQQQQQRAEKDKPSTKRSGSRHTKKASSSPPSDAVWAEPSRYSAATSAAHSSPSSAQSCAHAGSSYSSASSSSAPASSCASTSAVSESSYGSERKSARAERAERRERRRQQQRDRDAAHSLWSVADWFAPDKLSHNSPVPPTPSTTAATAKSPSTTTTSKSATSTRSSSSSSRSRSSSLTDSDEREQRKSDWWSKGKKGGKKDKLKHVSKKISKALQTVNDAAKRVWKAWNTHW